MSGLSKFRITDTAPTSKGTSIPELGLKYNPFPIQATVSITSTDERLNGGRFNPEVRSATIAEFQEKFINIDFKNTQHLRLGFLWSARIGDVLGFGKTAMLAHFLRKINRDYGEDLTLDQKVVALYVQPEPSTNSLKKLAELICDSLFRVDPITGAAVIGDIIKTIRYRVIQERPPANLFTNVLLPEFKNVEDFDRLVEPNWVERDWKLSGLRTTMRDYLLEEAGVNEDLAEILADYHDKTGFKLNRFIKRKPLEFLFGDTVSLLKLAGFNGAYLFIDDFYRGIESTTEKGRDIFAKQIRSWLFDTPSSKAAMEGFYAVIMTFHPDLERALANSWRRAGLHEMGASFDIDRSPGNNVELGLLDKDDTIKLLKTYTEPAIEDEEIRKQNPLHPLNPETSLIIATSPVKPRQLLNDAFELIEQAKRDKVQGELTRDYVSEFVQKRGHLETTKNDDLESFIGTRFG